MPATHTSIMATTASAVFAPPNPGRSIGYGRSLAPAAVVGNTHSGGGSEDPQFQHRSEPGKQFDPQWGHRMRSRPGMDRHPQLTELQRCVSSSMAR